MSRARIWAVVAAAVLAAGCGPVKRSATLNDLDARMRELRAQGDAAAARRERADIAATAIATAREMQPTTLDQQKDQVAWYRLAAVASFDAGPLGSPTLQPSSTEGGLACDRLPQQDATAPRDCTVLRLAFPLGVGAALAERGLALRGKMTDARAAGRKLSRENLGDVHKVFDGFESELERVTGVATAMPRAALPDEFEKTVENDERVLYCWLPMTIRLALAVDGENDRSVEPLVRRKETAGRALAPRLGVIDCRSRDDAVALPQ